MVLANWAILAILTSVVSDNMIASSSKALAGAEQAQHLKRRAPIFGRGSADKPPSFGSELFSNWTGLRI